MLTAVRLSEVLEYNPETGEFKALISRPHRPAGSLVKGTINGWGYRVLNVDGKLYRAHRLAWLYMTGEWPTAEIDHKDCDRANNCWDNLRQATTTQNHANAPLSRRNKSGLKGVCWSKTQNAWTAYIGKDRKHRLLGTFATKEEAHLAYCKAAEVAFGDFARSE